MNGAGESVRHCGWGWNFRIAHEFKSTLNVLQNKYLYTFMKEKNSSLLPKLLKKTPYHHIIKFKTVLNKPLGSVKGFRWTQQSVCVVYAEGSEKMLQSLVNPLSLASYKWDIGK